MTVTPLRTPALWVSKASSVPETAFKPFFAPGEAVGRAQEELGASAWTIILPVQKEFDDHDLHSCLLGNDQNPLTAVTANDTESEPGHASDEHGGEDDQPDRQGEVPQKEVNADLLGVLNHEDDNRGDGDKRNDCPATHSTSIPISHGAPRLFVVVLEVERIRAMSRSGSRTNPCPWCRL